MNWAYMHLVLNHFPIVGVIIGVLLLIAGLLVKNQGIQISGLGTVLFAAIMSVVAYLTGEPAENVLKSLPDIPLNLIGRHEDIATIGMYILITTGLVSGLALYSVWKKEKSTRFLVIITLVLSLISSIAVIYIGRTGGEIRHSEFRSDKAWQINNAPQIESDED